MYLLKLVLSTVANFALFGVVLFLPAGTTHWFGGWVFLSVVFVATILSILGLAGKQDLLKERLKPPVQAGQPLADKILTPLLVGSFYGLIAFSSADAVRMRTFGVPPAWLSAAGLGLFLAGWFVVYLGLRENAFAAPIVKHQEERGQTVVDTGIYALIRHPMYAGAIPLFFGLPLWLGSFAGLLAASVPAALMVARLLIEEAMLRKELKGYDAYMSRVRYRLIPGVW